MLLKFGGGKCNEHELNSLLVSDFIKNHRDEREADLLQEPAETFYLNMCCITFAQHRTNIDQVPRPYFTITDSNCEINAHDSCPNKEDPSTNKSNSQYKSNVDRQLIVTQYQNSRKRHTSPLIIQKPIHFFITKYFDFYAHTRNVHLIYTDRIHPLTLFSRVHFCWV